MYTSIGSGADPGQPTGDIVILHVLLLYLNCVFELCVYYVLSCSLFIVHCTHLIGVTSVIVESLVSGYWKCKDDT